MNIDDITFHYISKCNIRLTGQSRFDTDGKFRRTGLKGNERQIYNEG